MTDQGRIKTSLARHGLAPAKKRGQNFLVNSHTADTIVRLGAFQADDRVIEVGVGLGALTASLADKVAEVIGIEIDKGIIRYHEQEQDLPENVTLIHDDILKTDFTDLLEPSGKRLKIIANLPYSISNPFIFKLIDNRQIVDQVTVMLQKEVAERLTAVPGSKEYGIPTVLLGSCAKIDKLLSLKPAEFHPRPKIDSMVIRITFCENNFHLCTFTILQKIVRTAFSNRRKTLLNNLNAPSLVNVDSTMSRSDQKQFAEHVIRSADISPQVRAETLTIEQFHRLTSAYENFLDS